MKKADTKYSEKLVVQYWYLLEAYRITNGWEPQILTWYLFQT